MCVTALPLVNTWRLAIRNPRSRNTCVYAWKCPAQDHAFYNSPSVNYNLFQILSEGEFKVLNLHATGLPILNMLLGHLYGIINYAKFCKSRFPMQHLQYARKYDRPNIICAFYNLPSINSLFQNLIESEREQWTSSYMYASTALTIAHVRRKCVRPSIWASSIHNLPSLNNLFQNLIRG
jgi:hypothetical protein